MACPDGYIRWICEGYETVGMADKPGYCYYQLRGTQQFYTLDSRMRLTHAGDITEHKLRRNWHPYPDVPPALLLPSGL